MLRHHHGNSHTHGRLGCPKSGHGYPSGVELLLRLHQECPRVMELHYVSQRSNQGDFRDGDEGSDEALPYEFRC